MQGSTQGSTPRSKRKRLKTFFSSLRPSSSSQSLPGNQTHRPSSPPVENPVRTTQQSSLSSSMHTGSTDLDMTTLNNRVRGRPLPSPPTKNHGSSPNMTSLVGGPSPFSSATHSSPPGNGAYSPPHVETRGGLNIKDSISESWTSSSPPPVEPHGNPATNTGTSLLHGARDFVMNNPIINVQRDSNTVIQGMKVLSERVIEGAEYDSSLRDPPPQCHPGTRVQLVEKILTWFGDAGRERALLWLSGPAGVGKSAVMQTVIESLAESNSIGATLFFSRLNDRNDPRRVFITVAFQLATRIPAYRIYITERIAVDPSLLKKGMKDQFRIFITEPFGNIGIGKGEGPWAVFLDGLDECEGVDEQSRIIKLVSEFVLRYPDAPLIWAIASRPEPHIIATFNNEAVTPSYWSEYVPLDSTQACRDVEHYLDASFKAMRKQYPHLPSNWPSESQFLKLSNGALGLFVFAKTAVRFMEDPDHADPESRLDLILSIIDHLNIEVIDDHPFALLDALYTQILVPIPSSVWHTTKRILGFVICARRTDEGVLVHREYSSRFRDGLSYPLYEGSRSLMGGSVILGLKLSVAYGSLHKLHSVLDIPDSKNAHKSRVTFLHASFGDYLMDRARSKDFYIDRGESVDDISRCLFQLYVDKPWITDWERYASQLSTITGFNFYMDLKKDARHSPQFVITGGLQSKRGRGPLNSQQDRSDCLDALTRINLVEFYEFDFHGTIATLLFELWNTFRKELESTGRFKEVPLRDLQVDRLDYETNLPTFAYKETYSIGDSISRLQIETELQSHQVSCPERPVMIYGSSPENRIAFFAGKHDDLEGYFCFPFPY